MSTSSSPSAKIEMITPKKAAEYLQSLDKNRKLRNKVVDFLTDEIDAGRWEVTNLGIGIDVNNEVFDGQHRLHAIIKSGKAQPVLVVRGLSRRAKNVVDMGTARNPQDIITINGMELGDRSGGVVKQLYYGGNLCNLKLSNAVLLKWAKDSADGVKFAHEAIDHAHVAGVTSATVLAVLARAYFARPKDRPRIKQFAQVLVKGEEAELEGISQKDFVRKFRPVHALRKFLTNVTKGTRISISERYAKIENMLQTFLDGRDFSKVTAAQKELFPLAWDRPTVIDSANGTTSLPGEDGKRNFLIPVGARGARPASTVLKDAFAKGCITLAATKVCKQVASGDKVCFSCSGKVLGDAVVKALKLPKKPANADCRYPYELELNHSRLFEKPVEVSEQLGKLSLAKRTPAKKVVATLSAAMVPLTVADFKLLTR